MIKRTLITILLLTLLPVCFNNAWSADSSTDCYGDDCVLMLLFNGEDALINHTVTAGGNAQLDTAQKKFGTASLLLDGTGDFLTVSASRSFEADIGTGDFCVECWYRPGTGVSGTFNPFFSAPSYTDYIHFAVSDENELWGTVSSLQVVSTALTWTVGQWYHCAFTRIGSYLDLYRDGVSVRRVGDSAAIAPVSEAAMLIGKATYGSARYTVGHIDEFRLSSTSRYSANFTPSTTAFETGPNTMMLLHMDGTDTSTTIKDDNNIGDYSISNHQLTFNDDAQLDTAQKVFGTASILLDGTDDYVSIPDSDDWAFGSGDFNIDFWVRFSSVAGNTTFMGQYDSGGTDIGWFFQWDQGSSLLRFLYTTDGDNVLAKTFAWSPSVDTDYHIALSRSSDNLMAFIDGTQIGSTESLSGVTLWDSSDVFGIGVVGGVTSVNEMNGWMDEIRIVKGEALWTANFTPPTAAYTECSDSIRRFICIE